MYYSIWLLLFYGIRSLNNSDLIKLLLWHIIIKKDLHN